MDCPSCGHASAPERLFCTDCGTSLAPSCPSCGAPGSAGEKFCGRCGAALGAPAAGAPTSFAAGRYLVERPLGEGGKKRVYLARDARLDRDVALAVLKTEGLDEAGRARLQREAQAMGRLGDHPHVVTVHDIGEENGQPYIVSQFMAGGDVERLLDQAEQRRLPIAHALRIAEQVCQALEHAHARGILHRDVTLMFSDMEGFTEMTERLGDREAHRVIQAHHAIVRTELAAHDGTEVELQGDGFLLAFADARLAVGCAIAIQRAFARYSTEHREQPIRVRIGLHTGEAIRQAEGFFGKTVILTARIAAQARGGEILVSAATKAVVDARFDGSRQTELKGLAGRYTLHAVTWAPV